MREEPKLSQVLDAIYRRSRGYNPDLAPPTKEELAEIEKRRKARDDDRIAAVERVREATDRGRRYGQLRRAIREAQLGLLKHGHRASEREVAALAAEFERLGVPAAKASVLADASASHYASGDAKAAWTLADEVAGELVAGGWEPPEPDEELDPRELARQIPRLGRP